MKKINYKEWLADKVVQLRKQYPNDQEFGQAVAKVLLKNKKQNSLFPGIQNL